MSYVGVIVFSPLLYIESSHNVIANQCMCQSLTIYVTNLSDPRNFNYQYKHLISNVFLSNNSHNITINDL